MKVRKFAIGLASVLLLSSLFTTTVFAGGHGGGHGGTRTTSYSVCTVRNCTKTGNHKHSGSIYRAHSSGDGHSYHNSGSGGHSGSRSGGHH